MCVCVCTVLKVYFGNQPPNQLTAAFRHLRENPPNIHIFTIIYCFKLIILCYLLFSEKKKALLFLLRSVLILYYDAT